MVFETLYRALSSKRGGTGDFFQLASLLITITSGGNDGYYASPGNCDIVIGSGYGDIPFTATTLQSPLNLTRLSNTMIHHSGNNLIEVTGAFKNETSLDVTVYEVGLSYRGRLLCRDVSSAGVVIPAGSSHTFKTYLKIAANTYKFFNNLYSLIKSGTITSINGDVVSMNNISRRSDIAPIGQYDQWGSNDSMWSYGGNRCWWIDVGFSDAALSASDINLADGNYTRRKAGRTDVLTPSGLTNLGPSDPSYMVMEKAKIDFKNNTDAALTIREKGFFYGSGYADGYKHYMMTREILETPIVVHPGDTVTIEDAIIFGGERG